MFSIDQDTTTSPRLNLPIWGRDPGRLGPLVIFNSSMISTRAAKRLRKDAVSPGTLTNVPDDCSAANTSAACRSRSGVSTRYVAVMRVGEELGTRINV